MIELVQTDKNDILENQESLSQSVDNENKSTLFHLKNSSNATMRKPGTKTLVFRNHQLKMVQSASSDEDDSSQIHQSSKTKLTSGTKKGKEKSTHQQKEEHLMEIEQTDSAGVESAGCRRKSLLLQGVDCGKSGVLDDTCDVRPSNNTPLKADCKENSRQPKQDALCEESDGDGMLPKNANEEIIYVLDATKEGNVGRFLNHSCCPNLFAQSVFVETHNRSFPWVAFFTNRHVKAGTELTWDYGYEAGSMPETEISCHCGVQKCRKKPYRQSFPTVNTSCTWDLYAGRDDYSANSPQVCGANCIQLKCLSPDDFLNLHLNVTFMVYRIRTVCPKNRHQTFLR